MHMAAAIVASYSSTCEKCKAINFKVCAGADVTLKSLWATKICHGRLGFESPQPKNTQPGWESTRGVENRPFVLV